MIGVKEIRALQLVILEATACVHTGCLDFDVQTPVVGSVEENVRVASHLSKVPSIGTDAFTLNLIVLPSGVILAIGAPTEDWAGARKENNRTTRTLRTIHRNRCAFLICIVPPILWSRTERATAFIPQPKTRRAFW